MDSIEFSRSGILINGVRLVDLVRQAELPFAMAGAYTGLLADFYWPSRHFLGKPEDEPRGIREDGETMLLTCSGCGMAGCWSLLARIEVADGTVRWSGFRNSHRDRDRSAVGPFLFSRTQYEGALRRSPS